MATPQPATVELYLSGAWTPQTPTEQRVFSDDPIEITKGYETDGSTRPSKITLTFNNDTGSYDPDNPTSPLYGIAGRNTPIRVMLGGVEQNRAEISSYAPDATTDHVPGANRGRAETPIVAEGILRRLGRWTDPVRSPMYTQYTSMANVVGHWPMEDESDAAQLNNTVAGGRPGFFANATLASDGPSGAAQAVKLSTTSAMSGYFAKVAANNAGWQATVALKLAAIPASATFTTMITWTTTNGTRWVWQVNNLQYRVQVIERDGSIAYTAAVTYSANHVPTNWMIFRLKATQSGANFILEPAWYPQDAATSSGFTSAATPGSVGNLYSWTILGAADLVDASVSHILGVTTAVPDVMATDVARAFNGYAGEAPWDRFSRLCTSAGVVPKWITTNASTTRMGPQRPGRFLELIEECARTDDARIFDDDDDLALIWFGRLARYNRAIALALTYPGDIGPPLRKVLDDALTINRVTVKNARGGEATAIRTTGPMSVQPPPAGVGEYRGGDVEVNLESEVGLQSRADWELAKGTIPGARYPTVRVDLLANPALAAAAVAVRPGYMISITGKTPEVLILEVTGIKHQIGHFTRWIEFTCLPADVWFPARYDNTTKRYDSRSTTLGVARDAVQTAWTFAFPRLGDAWTVTPASWPFDVLAGGERCRVTAVGAVAGTFGAYTQAVTLTRSINGVIKAQTVGTEIHVADVARYAL
jgi:hypothetical protein